MIETYAMFILAGLAIYAVSSLMSEALMNQIRDQKTSLFGRSKKISNASARTVYLPPAAMTTHMVKNTKEGSTSVLSPAMLSSYGWEDNDGLPV